MKRARPVVPAPGALLIGVAAALVLLAGAGCGGGGDEAKRADETPTTVFGRQARDLAVGVAAQRTGRDVAVETTVLNQDGTPGAGLRVAVSGAGGWAPSKPCGAGRYCGTVAVKGPRPQLRVRLTRPRGAASVVSMRLPGSPQ